ncbi:arsenate reductase (glutaredoxin) [Acinetobacter sp.]|uniref:arsenate reductase (glutaredoxin) n=1 Tax=Acinetobacter sp. TaxID=472 RepID=UPI003BB1B925
MNQMPKVQIYHNPACGTSRNTLALIRNAGIEPEVIEYLLTPPSRDELIQLISDAGLSVRDALRKNVDPYAELNLDDASWSDEKLIEAMLQHPILINRPLVVTELGTRLCRPSEVVLDILPWPQLKAFAKEDGEIIVDQQGNRVK